MVDRRLKARAIQTVLKNGALLVFPVANQDLPPSLWSELHPNVHMRWEWDQDGDRRVADMWQLMKEMSDCREVVYSKWYQGRATFFSPDLFGAMLRAVHARMDPKADLPEDARNVLEVLENNSPLSTRALKEATDLQGRLNETAYQRAMKLLFSRLLIVGFGEVDDGAFPSLAVGATSLLYEDICRRAEEMTARDAQRLIDRYMPDGSRFRRYFDKSLDPSTRRSTHRSTLRRPARRVT